MTASRDTLSRRIRALRAKTVANGCTEAEALAAAELLADLLKRHNMTLDEAELRASPFEHHTESHDDWVGERLWKIAAAVAELTGVRYWVSPTGISPVQVNFFGFAHEVEVARYMLEICAGAMRREQARLVSPVIVQARQRRTVAPFLDGMADRLAQRLRALISPAPIGRGLVVLHGALVEQAMRDAGHQTRAQRARPSRDRESGYEAGRAAGDRVPLNAGLRGTSPPIGLLG